MEIDKCPHLTKLGEKLSMSVLNKAKRIYDKAWEELDKARLDYNEAWRLHGLELEKGR